MQNHASKRPRGAAHLLAALLAMSAAAGCTKSEPGNADTAPSKAGTASATTLNASDPWTRAQAIAEQTGAVGVERGAGDLPYLFEAKLTRGILVHRGAVMTARGPAALAAYLRDTGVLRGKSPSPQSLLTLLYVLRAFPVVPDLPEQSAIDTLGPEAFRPKVELVGGHARVSLYYWLPNASPGPDLGTRPMLRETLDIGPSGNPAWLAEPFVYTPR